MRSRGGFEAEQSIKEYPVAIEKEVVVMQELILEKSEKVESRYRKSKCGASEGEEGKIKKT